MQQILHDAISHQQESCHGLLAGGGNMIERCITVTKKMPLSPDFIGKLANEYEFLGIYLSSDTATDQPAIQQLTDLIQSQSGRGPDYYLLLESGHKGRVDALLFADTAFKQPVTLSMLEDGELYPASSGR